MTLDARGRRAGQDFRRGIDDLGSTEPDRRSFARFERFQTRKTRNRRLGAGLLALGVASAAIGFSVRVFSPIEPVVPATPTHPGGWILYGDWDDRAQRARWYTVRPDGTAERDLGIRATCAVWYPDGSRILITNDDAAGPGAPLRPAVVDSDGSNLRPLDAIHNPDLNLGCGDVSPDGTRIALEGFGQDGHPELDGIYSVRASDGGGLTRLLRGPVSPPRFSPDGSQLSFFDSMAGVSPPGSGALFVMGADSSDPRRITPWGYTFGDHGWSPDGAWIVFQRPFGQLYLVHPDGSGLHRVPLRLEAGTGAVNPSWSPDGDWIVFSLLGPDDLAQIYMVHPDGTELRMVAGAPDALAKHADWGMPLPSD
jgi:Tol biopolymer transport system component